MLRVLLRHFRTARENGRQDWATAPLEHWKSFSSLSIHCTSQHSSTIMPYPEPTLVLLIIGWAALEAFVSWCWCNDGLSCRFCWWRLAAGRRMLEPWHQGFSAQVLSSHLSKLASRSETATPSIEKSSYLERNESGRIRTPSNPSTDACSRGALERRPKTACVTG